MHQSQREFAGKKSVFYHLLVALQTIQQKKACFGRKVWSGEIDIGKNVVEKVIQKRWYDKTSGTIVVNTFTIYARKHTLCTLRVKFFNK